MFAVLVASAPAPRTHFWWHELGPEERERMHRR